jgi:phytoene synthase
MGVSDLKALRHAADLGIAMQLTNIARDVIEDAALGRIYLPLSWLAEAGVAPDELRAPDRRAKLFPVVSRLLVEAGRYYRSGEAGLRYLDFRSACAIAAAGFIYAEIGRQILKKGPRALEQRSVISKPKKLFLAGRAFVLMLGSLPERWRQPWSPVPIRTVWTYSANREPSLPL